MATTKVQPDSLEPLLDRLHEARRCTDEIFSLLRGEALFARPIPERHRPVFYLGHLEAFDWNLIGKGVLALKTSHPDMDERFAFGIDPVDGKLPHDQPCDWPPESEVRAYGERLRDRLDSALRLEHERFPQKLADGTLLNVAIEHRLMHAETLAYLLQQMPYESKETPENYVRLSNEALQPAPQSKMIEIPEGKATLGIRRDSGLFGWDNEFEENCVSVPAFRIAEYPVTNAEFLEFVQSGGYESQGLWRPEDWEWKKSAAISHPLSWQRDGNAWKYRAMFEEIPLPLSWPVYVSHSEASAFARWAGKKLPSEPQWHRAAYAELSENERAYPWGEASPESERGNFNFARWDPQSVTAHPAGRSAFGVQDLVGNGWEWTSSIFGAFPDFQPFPFYTGYSANFFDGKHFVMKGGAARTAACMLRRSFRNWFQPHYPYIYTKFRLVEE